MCIRDRPGIRRHRLLRRGHAGGHRRPVVDPQHGRLHRAGTVQEEVGGALLLSSLLIVAGAAVAAPPPLKTTLVEQGYDFSIHVISPPGDTHRLFVVERGGKIFLRKDGVRLKQPFLDLTEQTGKGHEYGLYSLALHPNFAVNRRLFVYYVDNKADTRVVEYRATQDLDHCDPAPVRTILAQTQAGYALHYGGFIAFGPDGFLYIGLGDGPVSYTHLTL